MGIERTWRSAAGTIDVRIAKCGPALCGTIARVVSEHSMFDPRTLEGYLYDRENRKMYACVMSLASTDRLRIHAYVGVQRLGQTHEWTRVAE